MQVSAGQQGQLPSVSFPAVQQGIPVVEFNVGKLNIDIVKDYSVWNRSGPLPSQE